MLITDSGTINKLLDLGEDRLKLMNKVGIDTQYCFLCMTHKGIFDTFLNLKIILVKHHLLQQIELMLHIVKDMDNHYLK